MREFKKGKLNIGGSKKKVKNRKASNCNRSISSWDKQEKEKMKN